MSLVNKPDVYWRPADGCSVYKWNTVTYWGDGVNTSVTLPPGKMAESVSPAYVYTFNPVRQVLRFDQAIPMGYRVIITLKDADYPAMYQAEVERYEKFKAELTRFWKAEFAARGRNRENDDEAYWNFQDAAYEHHHNLKALSLEKK